MRTRITRAILAAVAVVILGLGIPLAVVVQRFYQNTAMTELERRAAATLNEITLPIDSLSLERVMDEPDLPGPFSIYDRTGRLVFGHGPPNPEQVVLRALNGSGASTRARNKMVAAAPIIDHSDESVLGVVRVTESQAVVDQQVTRAWMIMATAAAVALVCAAALARAQARRLAAPVIRLAERAVGLGRCDFNSPGDMSGIPEVDTVTTALDDTAERLAQVLSRERAFSANVSHQLRTPLMGLRLHLEHAIEADSPTIDIADALNEIAHIEVTVEHLLALSRDSHPVGDPLDPAHLMEGVRRRWEGRFAGSHRALQVETRGHLPMVRASEVSIGQVLDVLLENGLRHGAGDTLVRVRSAAGGLVIEVGDEGAGISEERRSEVFDRREGSGRGIGLALARSITEAEGGRLLLASARPPRFHIVLPASA